MQHFMSETRQYQMSVEEIAQFLEVSERSGYKFKFILSGGEPLLWKNLKPGLQLLRASSVCKRIEIFSNATDIRRIDGEVMSLIDQLRLSEYSDNQDNIADLVERYGDKVRVVDRTKFWKNPKKAMKGVLPAKCLNRHQHLYMDGKMWACPHSGSIANGNGSKVTICCPLAEGFLDRMEEIFIAQQEEICTFCISNQKVRKKVERLANE